ncbi:MAG: hypothetical protein WCJ19_02895 [bacterium]
MQNFINRNYVWASLSSIFICISVLTYLVNATFAIKVSVYLGVIFLVLTMLPTNILKLNLSFLSNYKNIIITGVRFRRDAGIICGFLFATHSIMSIVYFYGFSLDFLFSKEIFLGTTALIVFLLLLVTSNLFSMKFLGKWWKELHKTLWIIIPVVLVHSIVASLAFEGEISKLGLLSFGFIMAFTIIELVIQYSKNAKIKTTYHSIYTIIGLIASVAITIFFLLSQSK